MKSQQNWQLVKFNVREREKIERVREKKREKVLKCLIINLDTSFSSLFFASSPPKCSPTWQRCLIFSQLQLSRVLMFNLLIAFLFALITMRAEKILRVEVVKLKIAFN